MLVLNDTLIIGKGSERWCYQHPENQNWCIKVAVHPPKPGRKPQSEREVAYFNLLKQRGVPFTHLPSFHGRVSTNLGEGFIFDLVLDDDQRISARYEDIAPTLDQASVQHLLVELRAYMYQHGVVPCDMSVKNILIKKTQDQLRLMLVDGVGNRDFIPLASYYLPYARIKIARIWKKFSAKLNLNLPDIHLP